MTLTDTPHGREATQARLLHAGLEVFSEKGISQASIGDICNRAGFSRGAFYSNFASKEEFFVRLYRNEILNRLSRIEESFEQATEGSNRDARTLSTRWLAYAVFDAFAASHERDESWFVMTCEAEALGLRDRVLGRELASIRADFLEEIAATVAPRLNKQGLSLNLPIEDAVVIIADLYESMLKSSLLTGTFPVAQASTQALVPRILEPLIRAHVTPGVTEHA